MANARPLPIVTHRARGNPSKLNLDAMEDAAPQPSTTGLNLAAPDHLPLRAKWEWEAKAEMLNRLGLLSEVDYDALAMYCVAVADWKEARKHLRKGMITKGKLNPWAHVADRAWKQMYRMQSEFGLSPSSRSRVTVSKKKGTDEQKSRFFGSTNPGIRPA